MAEPTGLNGVRYYLIKIGYHASAIALVESNALNYIGWYLGLGVFDNQEHLEHIGAMVRGISDSHPEPRAELKFGAHNKTILTIEGFQFRHLSLEEITRFKAGYDNPQVHLDTEHRYDYMDGKPMS